MPQAVWALLLSWLANDQVLVFSDLTTDTNTVEAVIERRDVTNDQASSDGGPAEEPSAI